MPYCSKCGKQVDPQARFCSNCGAGVNWQANGYQYRNTANAGFSDAIRDLEALNFSDSVSGFLDGFGVTNGGNAQRVEDVKNFYVPDALEELYDFAKMAYANIYEIEYSLQASSVKRRLSDAWFAKLEQAYRKAWNSYGNDPKVEEIRMMYQRKAAAIAYNKQEFQKKEQNNLNTLKTILIIAAIIGGLYFLFVFAVSFLPLIFLL